MFLGMVRLDDTYRETVEDREGHRKIIHKKEGVYTAPFFRFVLIAAF